MRNYQWAPMPLEFSALSVYSGEKSRGIVHTPEYAARMTELQERFETWRYEQLCAEARATGCKVISLDAGGYMMVPQSWDAERFTEEA
jgi:hypothetical protein